MKKKKVAIERSCSLVKWSPWMLLNLSTTYLFVVYPFLQSRVLCDTVLPFLLYLSSLLFFTFHNPFSSPFSLMTPRMQQDIPSYVLILFFLLIPTSLVSPLYGSSSYSFSFFVIFTANLIKFSIFFAWCLRCRWAPIWLHCLHWGNYIF